MELKLFRYREDQTGVQGLLMVDGKFFCYTLENAKKKIAEGEYRMGFEKAATPLTKNYRAKFDWFTFHLEIKKVSKRDQLYVHIGNYPRDVRGCIAVGDTARCNFVGNSTNTFSELYNQMAPRLEVDEIVTIKIMEA